jgi:zinc protease
LPVEAPAFPDRPAVRPAAPFSAPTPEVARLSNGVDVWVVPRPSLPLVSVVVAVPGGSSLDASGGEGLQWLTDRMLTQGAGALDAAAFTAALERLGATVEVETGRSASTLTLTVRKSSLPEALDRVADMILRPAFGRKDVARERGLAVSALVADRDEPVSVATRTVWSAAFGATHPYGRPTDGTVSGLSTADAASVRGRWKQSWNADGATVTVAGDVAREEIVALLEPRLGSPWAVGTRPRPAVPPPTPEAIRTLVVPKPGAAQTMIAWYFPGHALGAPEADAARIGTVVLGGTFTSRLNALLREKRGYTYGVRAAPLSLPGGGALAITTRVRADATGPALVDLVGELAGIRKGITSEELRKARASYRQDLVEALEGRESIAQLFAELHVARLPPGELDRALQSGASVGAEAVRTAMQAYDPARGVLVLVGDPSVVEPAITQAGLGPHRVVDPP